MISGLSVRRLLSLSFLFCSLALFGSPARAAAADRIAGNIDSGRYRPIAGSIHHLAQAKYDQGIADANLSMNYMVMLLRPSAGQQADLGQLLADQQNPASPEYHRWLTPETFADRFGLSGADLTKISAWLKSQGFTIDHSSRARNWIAFSGTAGQTGRAFHTHIHRYSVNGETHYANADDPQVPATLDGIVGGFLGLDDFKPVSMAHLVAPEFNTGDQHFLAPADFSTIYNLKPLQDAGLDGTGQSIAIVGQSDVLTSDLAAFRTRYGLPANTPKFVLYNGIDPGTNGALIEGALDLEWAGAIAPKATLYYVYGSSAVTAMVYAIEANIAPIVSISYGGCEVGFSAAAYEAIAQQASAQGITILASSGDSGAAGCDAQGSQPLATLGRSVIFPATLPEVTAVGGTMFAEGSGNYWATTNSATFGSALFYIPEASWNESSPANGLASSGGGASRYFPKPAWQTGSGVPNDNSRDIPDISLTAALHDAYEIVVAGSNGAVGGTSCGAPSMAGIVALLNQYQIKQGAQTAPGLGNINPQLYRLAQSSPSAFHDITSADNIVSCAPGTADCAIGSFGYPAGPGYDQATGLGSIDANVLFSRWNSAAQGVTVTLTSSATRASIDDSITLTATVTPASGSNLPTGSVTFTWIGGNSLGSVPLTVVSGTPTATLTVPLYKLSGPSIYTLIAAYSGDSVFSPGGAQSKLTVTTPSGVSAILAAGPNTVFPSIDLDAQGLSWPATFTLREFAGVAALLTGISMDGQALSLSQYAPAPNILASGSLSIPINLRNVNAPTQHTFTFTGIDASGATWTRPVAVNYNPPPPQNQFSFTATPLTVTQTSNAACQFPVQVNLTDTGGFYNSFSQLYAGTSPLVNQIAPIFGTTRLQAWSSLQGTICINGVTPPGSDYVYAVRSDSFDQQVQVNFAPAPANPTTISVSPSAITLRAATVSQPAQTTLSVSIADKTQPWTAAIYPANRTAGWLSASQLSGTGPAQITLTASGFGFEPGAYRAWIVIQCQNAQPQSVTVPIMFVLGADSSVSIANIADPATGKSVGAPGMPLAIFGSNLAASTDAPTGSPLPFSDGSITATVNNLQAPLLYVSPTQVNIQIPYEAGAGPAVLGINNNGKVAGFAFQIAPAAPGIYGDGNGNLLGNPTVAPGGLTFLYLNGGGDVTPALRTGTVAPNGSVIRPVLPLSVTVGGAPALIKQSALQIGTVATTQVQFYVPADARPGPQPVVVTVNGVASAPANVTVQAAGTDN
jgi:uncharacterized protein (TIGR03437 family)